MSITSRLRTVKVAASSSICNFPPQWLPPLGLRRTPALQWRRRIRQYVVAEPFAICNGVRPPSLLLTAPAPVVWVLGALAMALSTSRVVSLDLLADEFQDKAELIGGTFREAARANCFVVSIMKMMRMGRQMRMIRGIVEPVDLTVLPPALPVVGVFSGRA